MLPESGAPPMGKRYDLDDLVTLPEASVRLGLNEQALTVYRSRGTASWLPEPVATFGRSDVYDMRAIERAYDKHRGES